MISYGVNYKQQIAYKIIGKILKEYEFDIKVRLIQQIGNETTEVHVDVLNIDM